jgi:putative transposase
MGGVEYRTSAQAAFDIKYHFVWITKHRYELLRGRIAERARDQLKETCQAREAVIIRGAVAPDQIRMLVSREMAPAKLVPNLKWRSSRRLQDVFWEARKRYAGQPLFGRGAIFCSRGERGNDQEIH